MHRKYTNYTQHNWQDNGKATYYSLIAYNNLFYFLHGLTAMYFKAAFNNSGKVLARNFQ